MDKLIEVIQSATPKTAIPNIYIANRDFLLLPKGRSSVLYVILYLCHDCHVMSTARRTDLACI